MSRYLLKQDLVYRCDMESEAETLIEEMKEGQYELVSFTSTKKTTKDDEYFVVKFKQKINDEKSPI
jgi:hypothetical protein